MISYVSIADADEFGMMLYPWKEQHRDSKYADVNIRVELH